MRKCLKMYSINKVIYKIKHIVKTMWVLRTYTCIHVCACAQI